MARQIKNISKFSEDAIAMALNVLPEKEWETFSQSLDKITNTLGDKKTNAPSPKNTRMSDDAVFKNCLIPQIHRRMVEIENEEARGLRINQISCKFETNFKKMSNDELLLKHQELVVTEGTLKTLTLFAQYSRGLLYSEMNDRIVSARSTMREFLKEGKLQVAYITVLRYMTVSSIISNYPRLLICDLSMAQLLKHNKRLCAYLESDDGNDLKAKLSLSFEIDAGGNKVYIQQAETPIECTKFSTDPDWKYLDEHHTTKESTGAKGRQSGANEEEELLEIL